MEPLILDLPKSRTVTVPSDPLNVKLCSLCYAKEVSELWSYALPGPFGAGICPPPPRAPALPPPLVLPIGNSVCLQLPRRMSLDSVVNIREQPNPESVATGQCMCILFFISHLLILSFGTSPK
jgi:hypothetical protein